MAGGIPARLTRSEGRKFGLTVGGAFLALGLLAWWRGRVAGAIVCLALGGLLALAGLVLPTRLGPISRAWMALARMLSRITNPIFMAAVYFLILTPTGAIMRLVGRNPVRRPSVDGSFWVPRPAGAGRSKMERQF